MRTKQAAPPTLNAVLCTLASNPAAAQPWEDRRRHSCAGRTACRPPGASGVSRPAADRGSGSHQLVGPLLRAVPPAVKSSRNISRQGSQGGPGGGWSRSMTSVGNTCPQRAVSPSIECSPLLAGAFLALSPCGYPRCMCAHPHV